MLDTFLFSNASFLGNTASMWLKAAVALVVVFVVLKIFQAVIVLRLKKLASKTKTDIDDILVAMVSKIGSAFSFVLSLYIGSRFLVITERIDKIIFAVFIVLVTYEVIKSVQVVVEFLTERALSAEGGKRAPHRNTVKALSIVVKILLWFIGIVLILSNLGYNVNSLIAGLGIGGIAVALAVQNILGDLFSSFTLLLDKPFQVGDYIVIGADSGTVERIGMKTTRIKSLQGEELIVPNAELTGTRIQNFKKMTKRRVVFLIGITYETPHDKIKKVNDIVASIVNKSEHAELDRVHFKEFGDFSLNFEVVFYVNSSVYAVYMDTRQEINFALKEKFDKEGISFAYPTQTLFVEKV